jgi:Mg2+ and Co2+ transporter CorA
MNPGAAMFISNAEHSDRTEFNEAVLPELDIKMHIKEIHEQLQDLKSTLIQHINTTSQQIQSIQDEIISVKNQNKMNANITLTVNRSY